MFVTLRKHDHRYTEIMSQLRSEPIFQESLKLNWQQVSLYGTRDYIEYILGEERMSEKLSRVIFNERDELIGVVTLKYFNREEKTAHLGTWIGAAYWGLGYNLLAKNEILKIAFEQLGMEKVFIGAAISNERSCAAQRKLPYITENVGELYSAELSKIELETNEPCILNVVEKESFYRYLHDFVEI